jgi:enoyl-CoA hydratase/carnithine racemase
LDLQYVQYEKRGRVAIITFNRPERLNAFGQQLVHEANLALAEFAADDDAWVLIYTGTGRAFSAGADLKDMAERAQRGEHVPEPKPVAIKKNWKPTIAAVNGIAVGGGFEWAMRCDMRISSTNARFALPEVKRSIIAGVGVWKLRRVMNPGLALGYLLTAEEIDAQEAYRLGLVWRVVEPERLMDEAIALAERICENGPLAMRLSKQIWTESEMMSPEVAAGYAMDMYSKIHYSEDAKEGPRAFTEKGRPGGREQGGRLDVDAAIGARALVMGDQRGDGRLAAGVQPGLVGRAGAHGRTVGVPGQDEDARERGQDQVGRDEAGIGAAPAERRNRYQDQAGVERE